MIRFLYRQLITAASPLVYLYLLQRQRRGKEDRERFHERLGRSSLPRPASCSSLRRKIWKSC